MKRLYIAYFKPLEKIVGIYKDPEKMQIDLQELAQPACLEIREIYTDLFDPLQIK